MQQMMGVEPPQETTSWDQTQEYGCNFDSCVLTSSMLAPHMRAVCVLKAIQPLTNSVLYRGMDFTFYNTHCLCCTLGIKPSVWGQCGGCHMVRACTAAMLAHLLCLAERPKVLQPLHNAGVKGLF